MLRGYRCIILALVGWLSLSAQAPQPQAEGENPKATGNVTERTPASSVEAVQSPQYERPCDRAQDNRQSDLCAQWKAADAARDAADYARLQFWASLFGIAGLILTLWLTRSAVRAAQASVAVAQDTGKRQLRAYLVSKKFRVTGIIPEHIPKVHFELKNVGQTPAYAVQMRSEVHIMPTVPFTAFKVRFGGDIVGGSRAVIGAGEPSEISYPFWDRLTPAEVLDIRSGRSSIVAFGAVSYRDIFKRRRLLTFKMVLPLHKLEENGCGQMISAARGCASN